MPTWNAPQYLRFQAERTRPCQDLVARIELDAPRRIVDLGCGPGNSTAILLSRWPTARVIGIDKSEAMIAAARESSIGPGASWRVEDISAWADRADDGPFDLVFANAALQWAPDHARLFPKLLARVAPGGALAMQVPVNMDAPAHRLMRQLAGSPAWRGRFPAGGVREWYAHPPAFYYNLLADLPTPPSPPSPPARMDLWQTEYSHVLAGPEEIVEWYKGTGLRPFLDALAESDREAFAVDYQELIRRAFPPAANGRVLFPFLRLFLVAYRN